MAADENKKTAVFPKLAEAGGKPSLLQFGAFTLDLQRHGLYLGSKRVHLTSKPFDTLAVLVEHRGKTVEKQKLLDAVWKEAFVTEDSLVKAVREIRRVLGDEKESPQFIQTVPGEGYRFIAEVNPVNRNSEDAEREPQVVTSATAYDSTNGVREVSEVNAAGKIQGVAATAGIQPPVRFSTLWSRAAVVALIATLAGGFLLLPRRKSESSTQMKHISTLSGSHSGASFSRDGNWITFTNDDAKGVAQVWVQNLAQGEPIPITDGDVPASVPRWSPKIDEIVFNRGKELQSIWSVAAFGGLPTQLIEDGRNPSWSWDGRRLVFERGDEIWTANADGSNAKRVDGVPPLYVTVVDRKPSFSPNGSQIAYFQIKDGPMGDIFLIPSGGGQAKQLTFDNHFGGGLAWTPDGDIVFSSQRGGSKTLWKVHPSSNGVEPVLKSAGEDTNPEISRDGAKLIFTRTEQLWVLTLKDVASGKTQELRETITDMFFPSFSPLGDKIAFFATVDGGDTHIFTIRTDGKDPTQVTRGKGERNNFPRWSADGSTLYYNQAQPGVSFRKIPAAGGTSVEIARDWRWRTHNGAQFDPDQKRVIYSRMKDSTAVETLVWDMETGITRPFKRTLRDSRWSGAGKVILGVETPSSASGDIIVCPVDAVTCHKVASGGSWPIWPKGDSWIYFARWKSWDSQEIWAVSPAGEGEKRIMELPHIDPDGSWYDMSGTGQVVYVQLKSGKPKLWITNFP